MAGRKRKATAKKIEKKPTSDDPALQETRSPRSTIRGAAKKRPKDWEEDVILDLGRKAVRRPRLYETQKLPPISEQLDTLGNKSDDEEDEDPKPSTSTRITTHKGQSPGIQKGKSPGPQKGKSPGPQKGKSPSSQKGRSPGRKGESPGEKSRSPGRPRSTACTPCTPCTPKNSEIPQPEAATPSGRWYWLNNGKEQELCRLWESFSFLYDANQVHHRDRELRRVTIGRISRQLNIPGKDVIYNSKLNNKLHGLLK